MTTETTENTGRKRAARGLSFPCPYCQEPTQRKGLRHYEHVGQVIERHQCIGENGCRRYHMRHPETHAVIEVPEGVKRGRKPGAGKAGGDRVMDLAAKHGIDPDSLTFRAFDKGRPRVIVNCLTEGDLDNLSPEDAGAVTALQKRLLTIHALIGVYRAKVDPKRCIATPSND